MLKAAMHLLRGMFRGEGQEGIETPVDETASFRLDYGELEVGLLQLRDGQWSFRYSEAFRKQTDEADGVQPLVDFPDVGRVYESRELWPFFMARIPSLSQPRIRAEIARRGLDQASAPQLLQAFGEWSIANPFRLHAA